MGFDVFVLVEFLFYVAEESFDIYELAPDVLEEFDADVEPPELLD